MLKQNTPAFYPAVFAIIFLCAACAQKTPIVVLETNKGVIELKLNPQIAPKATQNFVKLAEKGYYDGVLFHRVIAGFMIQGGDPTGNGRGGQSIWGKTFPNEVSSKAGFDKPGILAMANAGPDTNASQFFITVAPRPELNMNYTIFGEVVDGYYVVERIANTETGANDRPVEEQKIIRAYLKK
ncbi:MAG: peptidylprolyl isomerase [Candidatus Omnitrophota bacterium]|nr:peptidylprolyl isomerase [Candidatus Omnitrophota bacterium]MDZ4242831.1 peptidylprolyl isomerase [Candidatus Omnitrophota bacterium]